MNPVAYESQKGPLKMYRFYLHIRILWFSYSCDKWIWNIYAINQWLSWLSSHGLGPTLHPHPTMPGGSCITATFSQSVSRSHTHPRAHTHSTQHTRTTPLRELFTDIPLAVRASEEWYNPALLLLLLLLLPLPTHTCACHQPNSYVSEAVAFYRHCFSHISFQRLCFTQCFCVCVRVCVPLSVGDALCLTLESAGR